MCQLSTVSIPSNVQEALKDPKWTQAMNDEMEALQKNSTWEMTTDTREENSGLQMDIHSKIQGIWHH